MLVVTRNQPAPRYRLARRVLFDTGCRRGVTLRCLMQSFFLLLYLYTEDRGVLVQLEFVYYVLNKPLVGV